jgi:hypothetical protein
MNRRDGALLLATARNNKLNVVMHTLTGIALIVSSIGFSVMIALYFGFDVLGVQHRPPFSTFASEKTYTIITAIALALIALVARIAQTVIEAKVTVDQEKWFAERLRASPASKLVPGNITRASNYYGRLSATSMRAVSIIGVLIVNLIGLIIHLPPHYGTIGIALILCCSLGFYGVMRSLAARMADATHGLFTYAKALNSWKINSKNPYSEESDKYFRSYYNRIFLSSFFSFTPLFFAFTFSIFILVMHELNFFEVDFGEVFIVFTILQAYLGLVGNFFGALVQSSAFLPAVRPYAGFIPGLPTKDNQTTPDPKSYTAVDHALENGSLEEL